MNYNSEIYGNFQSDCCQPDYKIAVPIPLTPKVTLQGWMATYNALDNVITNDIKMSSPNDLPNNACEDSLRLSKEERKLKISKYFEKKKKRKNSTYVRYQYRKVLADKRARFQGRFVKMEEIRELILKGEKLTAKDKSELEQLVYNSENEDLIKAYEESQNRPKQLFSMTKDESIQKAMNKKIQDDLMAMSNDYMSMYMVDQ